jgi:glycosyltransferase involved in cell wall biosynthesis
MNEEVSVIMPAYNAEKFIAESIASVIAQSYPNWELLIVDDGSTDATKHLIESFCLKDERIKYYYQQNGKQGKARNLALSYAKGTYIAFLDADDVWLPQKLEVQLEEIKEKNADLVFSDCIMFTDSISASKKIMHSGKGYYSGETAFKDFLEINRIPILTVLIKAEVLKNANGFIETLSIQNAEDYHLWLRLLLNGNRFYGSEQVLAGYREHAASSTIADNLAAGKVVEALEDLKQRFPQHRDILNFYLKQWFKKCQAIAYREDYTTVIKKNCDYVGKASYNLVFQVLYAFCGFNITSRLMNKIVNSSLHFKVE